MRTQNRLVANGKYPGVAKGMNELQDNAAPACNESHGLDKELTTIFDSKSLQEWHKICIDKNYLDKPKTLVDDFQIFHEQLKTFCNNLVPLNSKIFEDRLITVQIYDLNSLPIQAIRMSLFHSKFFANSIQVASTTIHNINHLNILPKGFVKESTLEICKAYNINDRNDSQVNNKSLNLACIKLLSDKNTHTSSKGNFTFFSNIYNRMKVIGFNQIEKTRMKSGSSSQNLLKCIQKQNTDEDVIRRNCIVKIDVNNSWELLERVLRYAMVREIPVVVVFNLILHIDRKPNLREFLINKGLFFTRHFANVHDKTNSNVLIFYMAQPLLNFHLTRSERYQPLINEKNNFIMVDIDFNKSKFQIITIYGSKMSQENEERLYIRLNKIIKNKPTILIVQSTNGRFHTRCVNGDLVLELVNEDLLNQLENTDGTLIYITKEFPEDIRNIRVFTGTITYSRNSNQDRHLEAYIVVTSMPLNQ